MLAQNLTDINCSKLSKLVHILTPIERKGTQFLYLQLLRSSVLTPQISY